MVIKVDLEKAYDRLSWNFIYDTLLEATISPDLVHLIMDCITKAKMNVLWEREMKKDFAPSGGIRQGDPISRLVHFCFVHRLSHGIRHAVETGD